MNFPFRRLSIESNQLSESVDDLRFGREQRNSNGSLLEQRNSSLLEQRNGSSREQQRNSNVRATLLIDYLNRDPTLRGINGSAAADLITDPLRPPPEIVEPEVIAEPESLSQDGLGLLMSGADSDQVIFDCFIWTSTVVWILDTQYDTLRFPNS